MIFCFLLDLKVSVFYVLLGQKNNKLNSLSFFYMLGIYIFICITFTYSGIWVNLILL